MKPALHAHRVWDVPVRVFHWSLVACVLLDDFVFDDGDPIHRRIGDAAAGLVAWRMLWGFIGSEHARFADFFPTPSRLRAHLYAVRRGLPPTTLGHNPLGALMMLALMACVALLGLSGWLMSTEAFWGEDWLEDAHEAVAQTLILLAGLHAAAAIIVGRIERTRLVKAMVTGVKEHC